MLPQRSYDSLILMLKNERNSILQLPCQESSKDRLMFKDTDLEITNKSNLYCQSCVDSFHNDLRPRIELFDAAIELLQAFDDELTTPIEIDDDDSNDYKYVISKQFISSFQRIMKRRMKEIVGDSNQGIDCLDMKLATFHDSDENESIDLRVNASIICTFL